MFERNKVDNSPVQSGIPVEITRDDGSLEKVKLLLSQSGKVIDALNGSIQFLEIETYEGRRMLIAKTTLRDVRVVPIPGAQNLQTRLREGEFDPYRVLGVEAGAGPDAVKAAYHARAKAYHPDRYANAELPQEVRDYLAIMARRINAAYDALEAPMQVKRQIQQNRQAPVYTSQPR